MCRKAPKLMGVFLGIALCIEVIGCAPKEIGLQIEGGVPVEQLGYYSDSFDAPKRDLWEVAAFSQTEQLGNFEMADVSYEGGRLKITTRAGAFSGAVVSSKFLLSGDFDIQIDCQMQFLKGKADVDQLLYFSVIKQGETFITGGSVSNVISKPAGSKTGYFGALKRQRGEYIKGNFRQISGFSGTIRFLRTGDQVSMSFRKQGASRWSSLDSLTFMRDDLAVVFGVQNFRVGRKVLNARESVTGYFDHFKINAAAKLIEKEI